MNNILFPESADKNSTSVMDRNQYAYI